MSLSDSTIRAASLPRSRFFGLGGSMAGSIWTRRSGKSGGTKPPSVTTTPPANRVALTCSTRSSRDSSRPHTLAATISVERESASMTDRKLERLDEEECLDLLRSGSLGRVSLRIGDSPAILPINYAVLDDDVVFKTAAGSKLSAAIMGVQVAFEVDHVDESTGAAWSVLVVGYAEDVREEATRARVDALGLESWSPGDLPFVVRIDTRQISGRRVPPR
jgi:nitroimidazol reductase NimA-like FMN-containing flavoprotein (pyridoxamine 5'-phosphate oxidase superfamily)